MHKKYLSANPGEWQAWQVGAAKHSSNKTNKFINTNSPIPTPINKSVNQYTALMCDDDDEGDNDAMARMSNFSSNFDTAQSPRPSLQNIVIEGPQRVAITVPTRHKALQALFKREEIE